MKKILYILIFSCFTQIGFSQEDENGAARIREKMVEYIQDRLNLSKAEAERFQPIFLDYFRELRRTNQEFKGDRLVLQQKVVELRLRFRDHFKPVIGEKRSNDVFVLERDFVNKVKEVREERLDNRRDGPANKKNNRIGL